jgi:hypothetical protein
MGILTYIPTLLWLVRRLCIYMTRNDATLRKNMTAEQIPVYNALHSACQALLTVLPPEDPLP